jgi:long-subunit fatty acid transport protein
MKTLKISMAALAALGAVTVSAGGFEKATIWSGHYSGLGGAATSHVSGGESLFFNPAGLAGGEGGDVSLNFSPTWGQYEGPIGRGASGAVLNTKGERSLSPVFGGVGSYKVTPELGVGAGVFVAGGSTVDYGGVDFSALGITSYKPKLSTKLSLTELTFGAGYTVMPGLNIGASWRYSMVKATLCAPSSSGLSLIETCLNDLEEKNMAGFRVGAQYAADGWGLGLNVRTPIKFTATGKAAVRTSTANAAPGADAVRGDGADASLSSEFPLQVEIGGNWALSSETKLFLGYSLSKYSVNEVLTQKVATSTSETKLDWADQHTVRLGAEHMMGETALRAGYVYVTPVTNKKYAQPTFSSPGPGHVINLGAGFGIMENMKLDLSAEYSMASGDGEAPAKVGEYKSKGYALHTGLNYKF